MQKIRGRLTYANVTATLALFLVLSGGVAYAASKLQTLDIAHGAVRTPNLFRYGVTRGKLAIGAVGSKQIGMTSVAPSNLKFPVSLIASPTGGEAQLTSNESAYPIAGGTWAQHPGEIDLIGGTATATLGSDGHEPCRAMIEISLNGRQIGISKYSTGSTAPEKIDQNLGSLLEIDPTEPTSDRLTASVSSNEGCLPTSRIDSARFRVLAFG